MTNQQLGRPGLDARSGVARFSHSSTRQAERQRQRQATGSHVSVLVWLRREQSSSFADRHTR
jgi:hypothetical protein